MIVLDYRDQRPLYEQIVERFQELIEKRILPQDMQMPSVRSQAMQLSINPNTIQRAYSELERRGYIYSIKGKGSFVTDITSLMDVRRAGWEEELEHLAEEGYSIGVERARMEEIIRRAETRAVRAGEPAGRTAAYTAGAGEPVVEVDGPGSGTDGQRGIDHDQSRRSDKAI